jgi:putative membrane protein insertion efficiency factor
MSFCQGRGIIISPDYSMIFSSRIFYLCRMFKILNLFFSFLLSVPVYIYRYLISPFLKPSCRHIPSCSQYTLDALKIHGPVRGLFLGTSRILRCRPGGTHGYDPVALIWIRRYKPWSTWFGTWKICSRLKEKPYIARVN